MSKKPSAESVANLSAENEALAKANETQLQKLEKVIQKGEDSFFAAARAVVQIVDEELFKPWFADKIPYFRTRWEMTPQNLTRYENAGRVLIALEKAGFTGNRLPKNEGQFRELNKRANQNKKLDKTKVVTLWEAVLEGEEKPTAKVIAEAAKNLFHKPHDDTRSETQTMSVSVSDHQPQDTIVEHTCSAKIVITLDSSVLKDALEYQGRSCEPVGENKWAFVETAKDKAALLTKLASWSRVYDVAEITIKFE